MFGGLYLRQRSFSVRCTFLILLYVICSAVLCDPSYEVESHCCRNSSDMTITQINADDAVDTMVLCELYDPSCGIETHSYLQPLTPELHANDTTQICADDVVDTAVLCALYEPSCAQSHCSYPQSLTPKIHPGVHSSLFWVPNLV